MRYSILFNPALVNQIVTDHDSRPTLEFESLEQAEKVALQLAAQFAVVTLHDDQSRYKEPYTSVIRTWRRGYECKI